MNKKMKNKMSVYSWNRETDTSEQKAVYNNATKICQSMALNFCFLELINFSYYFCIDAFKTSVKLLSSITNVTVTVFFKL